MKIARKLTYRLYLSLLVLAAFPSCKESLKITYLQSPSDDTELVTQNWTFDNSSSYEFNSDYIDFSSGRASLKQVDTIHSGGDFNSGTHVGTYFDSSNEMIKLRTQPSIESTHVNNILSARSSNLIGYWRFDGDLSDSSENGNDGTAIGDAGVSGTARLGSASLNLDGTADYVQISPTTLQPKRVTLSMWVKLNSIAPSIQLFGGYGDTGTSGYYLFYESSKFRFRALDGVTGGSAASVNSGVAPKVGEWVHLVGTYEGTESKIYVNGEYKANNTAVNGDIDYTGLTDGFLLGNIEGLDASRYFNGYMDEVAVWNEALTDSEIRTLFESQNSNFTELSPSWTPYWNNIVGYWKMDGNWQDCSKNENHGTASGNPLFDTSSPKVGSHSGVFDGNDDFLRIGHHSTISSPSELTLAGWVMFDDVSIDGTDSTDSVRTILVKGSNVLSGPSNQEYSLYWDYRSSDDELVFFVSDGTASTVRLSNFSAFVEEGLWYHIAAVWKSDFQGLYIDGKLMDSKTDPRPSIQEISFSDLRLGRGSSITRIFQGKIDDFAIWDKALENSQLSLIYNRQKQKLSGHYDSPIIDLGTTGRWTSLRAVTSLPFYKELTGDIDNDGLPDSESSAGYSSLVGSNGLTADDDLQDSLVAYWKFNEVAFGTAPGSKDLIDHSGNGFHGDQNNSPTIGESGIFGLSSKFDGATTYYSVEHDPLLVPNHLSISSWVKLDSNVGNRMIVNNQNGNFYFKVGAGNIACIYINLVAKAWNCGTTALSVGEWYHLVLTYDGISSRIYVNGRLENTYTGAGGNISDNLRDIEIGRRLGTTDPNEDTAYFSGNIDELSIWSRALSSAEILQLYRRGANRLKIQVRSCDDVDCLGESWQGPDGTEGSYFSELFNKSGYDTLIDQNNDTFVDIADYILGGVLKLTSPSFGFSQFSDAGLNISENRYFQYKVILEADDENTLCSGEPCMPDLQSISIADSERFIGGINSVTTSSPISFNELISIDITADSCAQFQLSNDGTNYYYWNDSSWAIASDETSFSSREVVEDNITDFSAKLGSGNLYLKVLLVGDTTSNCKIQNIEVTKR